MVIDVLNGNKHLHEPVDLLGGEEDEDLEFDLLGDEVANFILTAYLCGRASEDRTNAIIDMFNERVKVRVGENYEELTPLEKLRLAFDEMLKDTGTAILPEN